MSADREVVIQIPEDMAKRLATFMSAMALVTTSKAIESPEVAVLQLKLAVLAVYPDMKDLTGDFTALTVVSNPNNPMNFLITKLATSIGAKMPEVRRIERPVQVDNSRAMTLEEEEPPSKPI